MASNELNAIVDLAKKIVAAAPKLDQIEGHERRIDELKKNVSGLEATYRKLQENIQDATHKHAAMLVDTKSVNDELINKAKQQAGMIIANAQDKADGIVAAAHQTAKDIDDALIGKKLELQELQDKMHEAEAAHSNIKSILKNVAGWQ